MQVNTSISNNLTCYTDSNGLSMQKRIKNYRPSWNVFYTDEEVPANYYPINSAIYISDVEKNQRFTILNDRSQGGSSL